MTPPNAKLLTCHEIDRMYRLRNGTAKAAVKARRIRFRVKGRRTYVKPEHAEQMFGIP